MIRLAIIFWMIGGCAMAEALVATRTIRATEILGPDDIALAQIQVSNAVIEPAQLIGREAAVSLFKGRPVRISDVTDPAVVNRNQVIPLVFAAGSLTIITDGRALDRASAGQYIRVMNLSSRSTVTARIAADGRAYVREP